MGGKSSKHASPSKKKKGARSASKRKGGRGGKAATRSGGGAERTAAAARKADPPAPKPVVVTPLNRIANAASALAEIRRALEILERGGGQSGVGAPLGGEVAKIAGNSYHRASIALKLNVLDELVTAQLLLLDGIQSNGREEIRAARKAQVKRALALGDRVKALRASAAPGVVVVVVPAGAAVAAVGAAGAAEAARAAGAAGAEAAAAEVGDGEAPGPVAAADLDAAANANANAGGAAPASLPEMRMP